MESRINRHIATMSICLSLVLTLMASFSNPVVVAQTPTTTHISIVPNASTLTNTAFSPDTVTVVIGVNNTVSWTNNDNVIHTVVGDSFGALNTGNISPGASATFTFGTAGTYPYHCSIHPGMVGTVVVKGSAASGGGGIP
jgi:plastocyanin